MNASDCAGIINMNNLLVRGVRLRQFRMKLKQNERSCRGDTFYGRFTGSCINEYDNALIEEHIEGKLDRYQGTRIEGVGQWFNSNHKPINITREMIPDNETRRCFDYTEVNDTSFTGNFATTSNAYFYSTGGHQCDLMLVEEKDVLEERLRVMQNMDWVSKQTRAVIVEFSVYNAQINRFCVIRLTFHFAETGGVILDHKFETLNMFFHFETDASQAIYAISGILV